MTTGTKIRRARLQRGLTQKQFGILLGFEEKSADVRVAQYENDTRNPKNDLLNKMAEVLDINVKSLKVDQDSVYGEDLMFALFDIEDNFHIRIRETPDESLPDEAYRGIEFTNEFINSCMKEWKVRMEQYWAGEITEKEYLEWKLNWPDTIDDCGKHAPKKKWKSTPTE